MTQRLYTKNEVGEIVQQSRDWITDRIREGGTPVPEFETVHRGNPQPLWTEPQLDHWRAYCAGTDSVSDTAQRRYGSYSDHRAVNQLGPHLITWKLWWRCSHDGGTMWWFSTPAGWFTSIDDGQTWEPYGRMDRPGDYRYQSVNSSVVPRGAVARVLRQCEKLRRFVEEGGSS